MFRLLDLNTLLLAVLTGYSMAWLAYRGVLYFYPFFLKRLKEVKGSSGHEVSSQYEWRYVAPSGGIGARAGEASNKDVYEHFHGYGSWEKHEREVVKSIVIEKQEQLKRDLISSAIFVSLGIFAAFAAVEWSILFLLTEIVTYSVTLSSLVWMPGPLSSFFVNKVIGRFFPVADVFLILVIVLSIIVIKPEYWVSIIMASSLILLYTASIRLELVSMKIFKFAAGLKATKIVTERRLSRRSIFDENFFHFDFNNPNFRSEIIEEQEKLIKTTEPKAEDFRDELVPWDYIHGLLALLTALSLFLELWPLFVICEVGLAFSGAMVLLTVARFAVRSPISVLPAPKYWNEICYSSLSNKSDFKTCLDYLLRKGLWKK